MTNAVDRSRRFTDLVRAEQLPTRFVWRTRDTISVLTVPAIFLVSAAVEWVTDDIAVRGVADTTVRILLFAVLVVANAEMLGRHWRAFWAAPWRSAGLVLVGLVGIQVIISVLSALLRPLVDADGGNTPSALAPGDDAGLLLLLFLSVSPAVTALIEDFAFRHTLLLRLPVWSSRTLATFLVLVNALVFGAIHIHNFGGSLLLTLSYAGAGLAMNLVYLWTRNIWHVLLMHGLNNFLLGGPLAVILMYLLGAESAPSVSG